MDFKFYDNCLTSHDFIFLFESVGWGTLPIQQVEQALEKGLYSVTVKFNEKIVGMGRLVGDGVMYWYIQDVVVIPEYQGKNIGKMIIERLLEYVKANSLYETTTVGLMAAKEKEGFYKKFGFVERPNDIYGAGMVKKIIIN